MADPILVVALGVVGCFEGAGEALPLAPAGVKGLDIADDSRAVPHVAEAAGEEAWKVLLQVRERYNKDRVACRVAAPPDLLEAAVRAAREKRAPRRIRLAAGTIDSAMRGSREGTRA